MTVWLIWLVVAILLIIAEMTTFTFYLLWLGIGALAGMIVSIMAPESWMLQLLVAGIVALILTFTTKPITKKFTGKAGYQDPIDQLIGRHGDVIEAIEPHGLGIVRVGSETWSAKADMFIDAGEKVIIKERSTTILHVSKI